MSNRVRNSHDYFSKTVLPPSIVRSTEMSFIVFGILKKTMGLRVTEEEELGGLDISEHGQIAYAGKRERE